ncbi:MAG: hypothetical protein ED557_02915 [Balneola sp.]|nr:MAG: hypothetical protein ED557_02915 [Balneola sp.]
MDDKKFLFNNDDAYKLLVKARVHLLLIPYLIFIGMCILSIILALHFHDYKFILSINFAGIMLSQIYWSRMIVVWKVKVFQHQLFREVYREAIREGLIYHDSNWFSNLIIATKKERILIKSRSIPTL